MSTTEENAVRQLRADARRNRERILESAKEVFAEKGADAQMDDVARRAGVGVGTVYRHFPNKDVLMGELVTQKLTSITEQTHEALKKDDAWEGLCEVLHWSAEEMARNGALREALRDASAAYEYAEPARRELQAVTDKLVKRAQRQGELRKDFRAEEMSMLIGGVCASMGTPGNDWRRHLEIVLDGLRAGPPAGRRRSR